MKTLCLASSSPYRKSLLKRLGYAFDAQPPSCDEEAAKTEFFRKTLCHKNSLQFAEASHLAMHLAEQKALSLQKQFDVIIGSDQICFSENRILGKPGSRDKAVETLMELAGKTHYLLTAVCVVQDGAIFKTWLHQAKMQMRPLKPHEALESVDRDASMDSAGAYKLEKSGISLMDQIECSDWTGIEGLPLIELRKCLEALGPFPKGFTL